MSIDDRKLVGVLMPRSYLEDEWHLVLKLPNGYNMGVRFRSGVRLKVRRKGVAKLKAEKRRRVKRGRGPKVKILGVGGTIASRVDYVTGAVRSVYTPEDLLSLIHI